VHSLQEVDRAHMRSEHRSERTRLRRAGRTSSAEAGQGLVEFALVLTPLLLILLGIIQFGFIFNTYVTLTNAAREAAREGTVYVYDRTLSKAANDAARNEEMRTSLLASMNLLSKTSPQITTSDTWTQSGTTFTTGDLTIAYVLPGTVTESDPRTGQEITVRATYHQDLIIPLISILLPRDAGGRLVLTGEVTMVVN
jgi:Flp pilus assembly protein TadG